jgi:hypothetical protein
MADNVLLPIQVGTDTSENPLASLPMDKDLCLVKLIPLVCKYKQAV